MKIEATIDRVRNETGGLLAYCSVLFNEELQLREIKLIRTREDGLLVVMPVRRITAHCKRCGQSNPVKSSFCNRCGARFECDEERWHRLQSDLIRFRGDLRREVEDAVISAWQALPNEPPTKPAPVSLSPKPDSFG